MDSHGKAIYALIAAFVIFQAIAASDGFIWHAVASKSPSLAPYGMAGGLLISIGSALAALAAISLATWLVHALFEKARGGIGSLADQSERVELQRDVAAYQKWRDIAGDGLGLISIALVVYVLYRITRAVPGVLSAFPSWKGASLTHLLGTGGTIAVSVFIGAASLVISMVVLNSVFRRLGSKPN